MTCPKMFPMQAVKIFLACVAAAILYGIVHDQITAHLCIEYFTVFHPKIINSQSPTLLALAWGVVATWWVGAILGVLLAIVSQAGARPKLGVRDLLRPICILLAIMGGCAVAAGTIGYASGWVSQDSAALVPISSHKTFAADVWAHTASYLAAGVGGLALCVIAFKKRLRMSIDIGLEPAGAPFPKLAKIGAGFILTGIAAVCSWALWSETRTWVPVDMPVSLTVGHIRTREFKTNQNAQYEIEIDAERNIPFQMLNCLLGVEDIYPERCKNTPPVVRASWVLLSGGAALAHGSSDDFKGGGWSVTISRGLGSVTLERGKPYVLDVDILTDGTLLQPAHPRLKIGVHPDYYEANMWITLMITAFAGVLGLIGIVLLLIGLLRKRPFHEMSPASLG